MQEVLVGSKYQVVIPKEVRKKIAGLKPGIRVAVSPLDETTVAIRKMDQSWVAKTKGIAKKAWAGIDTTKYLKDLKREWLAKA